MIRPRSRKRFARGLSALAGALALGAAAGLPGCGHGAHRRPNLLLISLDSTRRDLLDVYGYRAPHAPEARSSPNLDALAEQGVVMENAHSTTSWTLPSHVSILTGEPEVVHAVDVDFHRPDPARPMLAEILHGAGYRTAGFYSGPYLEPQFGFDRGFDRYEACYGPRLAAASRAAQATAARLHEVEHGAAAEDLRAARAADTRAQQAVELESHRDVSSIAVSEAVIAELRRAHTEDRPFFVFAHFFDPHYDYVPPEPYAEALDPQYTGDVDGHDFYTNPAISRPDPEHPGRRIRVVDDRDLEHVKSLYAAELAWTDAQIGMILRELDRLHLTENTLVVVLADHGDEFFEHGGIGHRSTLFEELVRVPLILRLPGTLPAGARVHGLVSTIDVLPTVLDLLGVPEPEGLVSKSFLPLIRGESDGAGRVALGRIAASYRTELKVPERDSPKGEVPGLLVCLIETFRRGPIKVTRERRWTRPLAAVSPRTTKLLAGKSREMRAKEELRWIDVEAHPDERPEDESTDFSDPRAREALRAFHDLYVQLLAERGHADLRAAGEAPTAALRGLGYVGPDSGEEGAAPSSDEFTLPPPGEAVLEAAAR